MVTYGSELCQLKILHLLFQIYGLSLALSSVAEHHLVQLDMVMCVTEIRDVYTFLGYLFLENTIVQGG